MKFKTLDLCAGIGGIRKGFELTGYFENVLAAEIDKFACKTYEHLYNQNAFHDLTDEKFKTHLETIKYDVLLAGFPCQTFSRAGKEAGFEDSTKGTVFNHIAEIIKRTRPKGIFLENVDHLVRHDEGNTFKTIILTLEKDLNYKVVGVTYDRLGEPEYSSRDFIRNSKYFGIPQNRPRTYIMAFDRRRYGCDLLLSIENHLPERNNYSIYENLNELLEMGALPKYYLSSGYFDTLCKHREREHKKGNGFGYKIVNDIGIEHPVANTITATGGSGRERNLVLDPQVEIAGLRLPSKKSPLNNKGVRFMTPREWGKLQGFINYAFVENGYDKFTFPEGISNQQMYKQFGNSVTIPVIETMAEYMINCFIMLGEISNK